ncbi:MAG: histidine kinase [Ignavibacteriales bacterium]|nr:histidine kinase [Ignavibacteriales bacterium]
MNKLYTTLFCLFLLRLFAVTTAEISAAEPQTNILTSHKDAVRLNYWQIAVDVYSKDSLPALPDSLWQLFNPALDDYRYTEGNWLIKTGISIPDTLNPKVVYGLFPVNLVTAYEIYWDGVKTGQTGVIGNNIESEKPGDFNYHLPLAQELLTPGKHTIVIRLSDYNNIPSWKWYYGDVLLGRYDVLMNKISRLYYQAFFVTGILLIPFLFNLFLYFARKRKMEHLLFGLICFVVILDSLTMLLPMLIEMRNTYIYLQYYSYNVITFLFTVLFPAFFIYLFSFDKKIIWVIAAITLILFFFFTDIGNLFNVMALTVLIFSSIITMVALYKRREESVVISAGIIAAWGGYYFDFAFAGLATTMVICTSFSIARQFARKERTEKEAQLKSARLENELLKKNINPHFVLNTLTSIIAWLRKDTPSAVRLIEALADEFRMVNQISSLKQIPLKQELELCRAHLKIMSYRKGADYKLETTDIDEESTIPPMILHTLVENGLTHGYENKTAGTFVIRQKNNPGSVQYIISNDGEFNPEDSKGSTGFGSRYIMGRLEESYPGKWKFISNKTPGGWESVIEIRRS